MKLHKSKTKFKRFFKLHFIKSRVYEAENAKTKFADSPSKNLSTFAVSFRKALQIILKFHLSNKHILFSGIKKIPSNVKIAKISFIGDSPIKAETIRGFVPKGVAMKYDLIVIFDKKQSGSNEIVCRASFENKTPVVRINGNLKKNVWGHYEVLGNYSSFLPETMENLPFVLIHSMLKKFKTVL